MNGIAWEFPHRLLTLLGHMTKTIQAHTTEVYPPDDHTHTQSLTEDKQANITKHKRKNSVMKSSYWMQWIVELDSRIAENRTV